MNERTCIRECFAIPAGIRMPEAAAYFLRRKVEPEIDLEPVEITGKMISIYERSLILLK